MTYTFFRLSRQVYRVWGLQVYHVLEAEPPVKLCRKSAHFLLVINLALLKKFRFLGAILFWSDVQCSTPLLYKFKKQGQHRTDEGHHTYKTLFISLHYMQITAFLCILFGNSVQVFFLMLETMFYFVYCIALKSSATQWSLIFHVGSLVWENLWREKPLFFD